MNVCWKKMDDAQTHANKRKEITALKIMSRIDEEENKDDQDESGDAGKDEVVSTRSTRNKKNKANNYNYSRIKSNTCGCDQTC